jgi:hypothetical protein
MALSKAITQPSGYDATYWRLVKVDIDWEERIALVRLKGYKNKQTRKDRPQAAAIDYKRVVIRGVVFDRFFDVPETSQIPEWDDATPYSKGALVQYGKRLWQAEKNVSAGSNPPSKDNPTWSVDSDLRLNREIAYSYIKKTIDEFSDATDV